MCVFPAVVQAASLPALILGATGSSRAPWKWMELGYWEFNSQQLFSKQCHLHLTSALILFACLTLELLLHSQVRVTSRASRELRRHATNTLCERTCVSNQSNTTRESAAVSDFNTAEFFVCVVLIKSRAAAYWNHVWCWSPGRQSHAAGHTPVPVPAPCKTQDLLMKV